VIVRFCNVRQGSRQVDRLSRIEQAREHDRVARIGHEHASRNVQLLTSQRRPTCRRREFTVRRLPSSNSALGGLAGPRHARACNRLSSTPEALGRNARQISRCVRVDIGFSRREDPNSIRKNRSKNRVS
jgi:hypothetical protein